MTKELLPIEEARKLVDDFGRQTLGELGVARQIATAALEEYGDFDEVEHLHFTENGIWNDHSSVQASLATIRLYKPLLGALEPIIAAIENTLLTADGPIERLCLPVGDLRKLVDTFHGRVG